MARKSRKNVPVNVSVPSGNLTSQAVMELDKETKPYQVAVYARLSHESEANRERDTVETQISYIKNYVAEQLDMVVVDIYADVSVSGTTFERPEFERMMQDIRAGRVNTVITRDLSRLGRNYVESGNYIERVFPFLDVRFIAITDDFDTARPGTDLSMPLKNIVNEYYSKDLSEKVSTGKRAIWLKGEFCEFLVPYGYRKENKHLVVNEETRENVVHIFEWFLEGRGYNEIARMLEEGGNLSPQKYRLMESGKEEAAQKAKGWIGDRVKKILGEEYYIGNSVHGRQRRALETGRKNILTPPETWVRIENTHAPIIDKDTFYKVQEEIKRRTEKKRRKCQTRLDLPTPPENKFKRKIYCAECGKTFIKRRWYKDKFYYTCRSHHSFREVYNEYVKNHLTPENRTGTIIRNDYWRAFPEVKENYLKDFSKSDYDEFIRLMDGVKEMPEPNGRVEAMTSGLLFRCCALGYEANHYQGCELSPKEQYLKHADGRDEGLCGIDENSPDAFETWYNDRMRSGGHPWEVCRGGNSTHVDLCVMRDEKGYYFYTAGNAWNRSVEAAHFYLSIYRAGYPVTIRDGRAMADRFLGVDRIGIVPAGVIPNYCESYFPGEKILDFMNLDKEDEEKILEYITWQDIPEQNLV